MPYPLFSTLLALLLGLLTSLSALGQTPTPAPTYYTYTGRLTACPDSANYYTVVHRQGAGGSITTYQPGGQRLHREQYSQLRAGQRHGLSTEWDAATGHRVVSFPYQRGRLQGLVQAWYPTGQRRWQLTYRQGQRQGTLRAWYPTGRLMRTENYQAGVRTTGRCYTSAGRDTAWFAFERPARFKGPPEALQNWLSRNLRYPAMALRNQVEGNVWVRFVVDAQGLVREPELIKPIGAGTDEEILRLLRSMPAWEPAVIAGRAVAVPYQLPIEFRIR